MAEGSMDMADREGPDPIDVAVGLRLRTVRRSNRMSQDQLGRAIGVTFQQIQKYERGSNRISASMLVKAGRALGIGAAAFLPEEGDPTPTRPPVLSLIAQVRGTEELVEAFARIRSSSHRYALLVLARTLADDPQPADSST